ncbi:MAG: hypothetical protein CR967_05955, partial [Proteobacteria bacterium]
FALASNISTDIMKKISKAVGTKDLLHIFERIHTESKDNIAYELLKHGVALEFNGQLQNNKIISMHKRFTESKNILADSTLKSVVLDHIYMFETSYSKKVSICAKLDIGTESNKKKQLEKFSQ